MRVGILAAVFSICSVCASAQTQWDHNGSVMTLFANGANRTFTYQEPRAGLPVTQGTVLFSGKRIGDTYQGTARVFSQRCGATGYPVSGQVGTDQRSVTMFGKRPRLDALCRVVSHEDDVLIFSFLDPEEAKTVETAEDSSYPLLVCLRPVFLEEIKLREKIDGERKTTMWVAQAINHLQSKYCREIDGSSLQFDDSVHVNENCFQYTGTFHGERVFWGGCRE